jgi:putative protease
VQLRKLELLAPAKNKDIGTAAINCGADALYIAGPSFGAREAAGNSMSDIEELAKYAHRYGAKVYMVLNTILYQNEINEAVKLSNQAYQAGCDALIIQDLGLLKAGMPPIPLFASTQTNIRSVEQAVSLKALGFQRLILARELSLSQIKEIRDSVDTELESFIHGALCVSYSGQCYLSESATHRSANRGVCSQMCRSTYNLMDREGKVIVKDKALLSLKDLNLGGYIPELVDAGITSFKIEGRLKNVSYIKNVVKYYRSILDSFLSSNPDYTSSSCGKLYGGFTPRPELTFNRGYTELFIGGVRGEWRSAESTKSVGEYIGTVEKVINRPTDNLVFDYKGEVKIQNGDGLCFILPSGKILGARASSTTQKNVTTNERVTIPTGSQIYRNYNHLFEKELEQNMPKRLIIVELIFVSGKKGNIINAKSEDGVITEVSTEGDYQLAKDEVIARRNIYNQLEKTAGIYKFTITSFEPGILLFYPVSVLNRIRREIADKMDDQREAVRLIEKPNKPSDFSDQKRFEGLYFDYRANVSNNYSKELYYSLGAIDVGDAFEISPPVEAELMRCPDCIKFELGM